MAEQIVTLLDDPVRRAEMGRIGRARVETELSWEHQKPKLVHAYRRLFGEPRRATDGDVVRETGA
jgi:glycosyltransferase involved in cell wall biosynthesis